MESVKTMFLGSNWESLQILKAVHHDPRFEIVAVITKEDKPVGRKQIMEETPVKKFANENGIRVFHTNHDPSRYEEVLREVNQDLNLCVAFGEIIPESFLDAPKYSSINVHFSLLPKYRGAVPIQMAILNGDQTTGISIVKMVSKLDAGPVLAMFEEKIEPTDTNLSLRERLVDISTKKLPDVLNQWCKGEIEPVAQDESNATLCMQKDIAKENAQIDWKEMDPHYIERMIRAFIPWPVAWCSFNGQRVKIFKAQLIDNSSHSIYLEPGEFKSQEERLFVGTQSPNFLIQPLELQLEGRERMSAAQFVRGQDI